MSVAFEPGDASVRVTERIEGALPTLPVAMRKVAEVILADPHEPLTHSITDLAERAGTSPATITRFCRAVGYPGYVQFRVAVAADLGRSENAQPVEIGRAFGPDDTPEDVLRLLLNANVRSIKATAGLLDMEACAQVAGRIAVASHVDLYGVGGSGSTAQEMADRLYRIGVNAHAWRDVHEGLASATLRGPGTVAMAISHSGTTSESIEMLRCARDNGALTVAVTSRGTSSLAQLADITLIAAVPAKYLHPADLSAKHAQLFVMDVVYMLVAGVDYSATLSKLTASAQAVAAHRNGRQH